MTKQQTVELLQNQLPSFYSLEQVINIVNQIEEPAKPATVSLTAAQLESLIEEVSSKLSRMLGRMNPEDFVDFDSAEMDICRNEVSLASIDAYVDDITEHCTETVRETLIDFFTVTEEVEEEEVPA